MSVDSGMLACHGFRGEGRTSLGRPRGPRPAERAAPMPASGLHPVSSGDAGRGATDLCNFSYKSKTVPS